MRIIIIASLALISYSVHAETMYKWVDNNGQVHYSNSPLSKDQSTLQTIKVDEPIDDETYRAANQRVDQEIRDLKKAERDRYNEDARLYREQDRLQAEIIRDSDNEDAIRTYNKRLKRWKYPLEQRRKVPVR